MKLYSAIATINLKVMTGVKLYSAIATINLKVMTGVKLYSDSREYKVAPEENISSFDSSC